VFPPEPTIAASVRADHRAAPDSPLAQPAEARAAGTVEREVEPQPKRARTGQSGQSVAPERRRSRGLPKAILLAGSILVGGVVLEGGLRLLSPFPIHSDGANRDPHEALGYVVSPAFADIDSQGFRNPDDLDRSAGIDLFALGDSHTFGQNVASEESWPQQLARMANLRVYNYGVGGYGILQYAYLFDRALERRPKHIVVGLYLANDLARFCKFARMPYWRETLAQRSIETPECEVQGASTRRSSWGSRAANWVKSTALGSALIYHVWYPLEERMAELGVDTTTWQLRYAGDRQTFLSAVRIETGNRVMDLSHPGIAAADRAARKLFAGMADSARRQRVKLSVLLIPSKENTILDSLSQSTPHLESIRKLVESERALIESYRVFFEQIGVETASGRAALLMKIDGTRLYPDSADSHPLATGYLAYAEAALPLVTPPRERPSE